MIGRPSKQTNIAPWLQGLLAAGRRKAEDVLAAAKATGYSERTLRRVKAELGILSEQEGEVWYWRDPAVAQPKAASDDKLDILIHEVKEATRLAMPAVPVASVPVAGVEQKPIGILGRRSRAIDIKDPEVQAQFERIRKAEDRFEAVQNVVTSPNPFVLLNSADEEELDQMLLLVRNHRADLEGRSRKMKFVKNADGHLSQAGFEDGEDLTLDMGKWDEWIDQAKQRQKRLMTAAREQKHAEAEL